MECRFWNRTKSSLGSLDLSPKQGLLIAFVFGVIIRILPELLSLSNPIGFDTIYYAWRTKNGVVWSHWSDIFSTWLLYAILAFPNTLLKIEPFLLIKFVVPLIFGLNTSGIFFMATKAFGWSTEKSLFASGFFSFQLATLRISWDLYRNLLGLGFLLFTLPLAFNLKGKRNLSIFVLLSISVIVSHEYSAVILFAVVFGALIFKRRQLACGSRVLIALIPSLCIFLASVSLLSPIVLRTDSNAVDVGDDFNPRPGGLFFLVDYLQVSNSVQDYSSYFDLASDVLLLFGLLYIVSMPLILFGAFRDKILDLWTSVLLVGSFSCLVVPYCALDLWNRWMLMLAYPFAFYVANGAWKILKTVKDDSNLLDRIKLPTNMARALMLLIVLFGFLFMATPLSDGFGLFSSPKTNSYFPPTMQLNTIPLDDVDDVVASFNWLNENVDGKSCLLAHQGFVYWALLNLEKPYNIFCFQIDLNKALQSAMDSGFRNMYFVWWNEDLGWYGIDVPNNFVSIFRSSRISIFEYSSS